MVGWLGQPGGRGDATMGAGRFVYHARSPSFQGTTIHSLTALRELHPELYAAGRTRYVGRESNLEIVVPILGVLWNDVIHLMPVDPHRVFAAQQAAGQVPAPTTFFRIPIERLPTGRTLWFRFSTTLAPHEQLAQPPDDDFVPFDPARYRELADVPARTVAYYHAAAAAGLRPMPFRHIPQVLVHGPINVAGVEVVDWSQAP